MISRHGYSVLVFLSVFLGAPALTAAQQTAQLAIVDADDGRAVPAATVVFRCLESDCLDSSITRLSNPLGFVDCPFTAASEVKISCVGYATRIDTILPSGTNKMALSAAEVTSDEIVVTAQFRPGSGDRSLYDVEVLRAEQIEAQGANSLAGLLANRAGVRMSQDNLLGASLGIQGVSGRNVKILIDGVPVIGRVNGNVDLNQINLSNAERVEIVDDPLSVVYGTDALGGVINVITKDNAATEWRAQAGSYLESSGHYNADGMLAYTMGDLNMSLAGGRNFFAGFNNPDTSRFQQWKPKEQYFGDFNAVLHSDDMRLRLSTRYFNEFILNRGEPRAPYRETAFDDEYHTARLTNSLFVTQTFGAADMLDVTLANSWYRRRKNSYFKDLVTLNRRLTNNDGDQDTSSFGSWLLRASWSHDPVVETIAWQAGVDINLEDAEGGRIEEGLQDVGDYALFAGLRYQPVDMLTVQPGLRYAYNTRFDAPLLPSLNAKVKFGDAFSMRASYAEGFRAPSLRELYFLFVDINHNVRGNTELDAERSRHYNLDLRWVHDMNQNVVTLEPGVFYNDIRNLISLAGVENDLYSYVNIGTYRTVGGNVTMNYYRPNATAEISFAYIGRYNRVSDDTSVDEVIDEYAFAPELAANVMYTLFDDVDLNVFYKYTGELPQYGLASDGTITEGRIADYHMLDVSFGTHLFDDALALTAGVKNVFDVVNIENSVSGGGVHADGGGQVSIGTGRSLFMSLQVQAPFSGE